MKDKAPISDDFAITINPVAYLEGLMDKSKTDGGNKEYVINNLGLLWNSLRKSNFMHHDREPRIVKVGDFTDEFHSTKESGVFYVLRRDRNGEVLQRRFVDEREEENNSAT